MQKMQAQVDMIEAIPGYIYALCHGKQVMPFQYSVLYHGSSEISSEACRKSNGLPPKGNDIDLIRHIEPPPDRQEESAFRGTVPYPAYPGFRTGAAEWAGIGGYVFRITSWPGYDISSILEGQITTGALFRGPLMREQEIAIPARVPSKHIPSVGQVVDNGRGLRVVWEEVVW